MPARRRDAWGVLAYTIGDDKGGFHAIDQSTEDDVAAICSAADFGRVPAALQLDLKRHPGIYRAALTPQGLRPKIANRQRPEPAREASPRRAFHQIAPRRRRLWRDIVQRLEQSALRLEEDRTHLDSASAGVLRRFLSFAHRACPADRYILHFSGHSFGPMGLFYDSRTGTPNPHALRLTHLAGALRSQHGALDVVLFRDCFMDNLEAAFELHGAARFVIATQAQEPIRGVWPWLNLLSVLTPSVDSGDAARSLGLQMEDFFSHKSGLGALHVVPCALIDIERAREVTRPLKKLVAALSAARSDPARRRACSSALERARLGQNLQYSRPGDPALVDVPTMCRNLEELVGDPVVPLAQALGEVVRNRVITSFHVSHGPFQGLVLYYKPTTAKDLQESFVQAGDERDTLSDERYYRTLALSRATGWDRIALNPLGA